MGIQIAPVKRLFSVAFQVRFYSAPAERAIPAAKQKYVPTSGSYPKGFLVGSAHAGVKPSNTQYDDIALVASEEPCIAAAVFTRNMFKAAPVATSLNTIQKRVGQGIRGVVVNAGCANAITGPTGRTNALEMAQAADRCFEVSESSETPRCLVMSTGVIGQKLPMPKILDAIPRAHAALGSSHEHWMGAARAICTTDTFPKLLSRTFTMPSHPETEYRIAGMTKGAGMIHPNMGTLLGIVCTDAKVEAVSLRRYLRNATNHSFNSISIDGDTSTNDTVALFANGAAAPSDRDALSYKSPAQSADGRAFYYALQDLMTDLAKLVVRDGEGATKFVTVRVQSDVSFKTARRVATSVATSALVKTALYGKDANWGRILCAIGYAPGIMDYPSLGIYNDDAKVTTDGKTRTRPQVQTNLTSVSFVPADGSAELKLLTRGEPEDVDEARAKEILEMEDLEILVKLDDSGRPSSEWRKLSEAVFWTCDFSHEYVTINGDYRT